jgi:cytochrome b involved in lipid metabolism
MIKKIVTISLIIFIVVAVIILGVNFFTKQNTKTAEENQNIVVPIDNTNTTPDKITLSQISEHATSDNCWVIVSDKVYNVTEYINIHPGGPNKIMPLCGDDATTAFTTRGGTGHSPAAQEKLSSFYVGELAK